MDKHIVATAVCMAATSVFAAESASINLTGVRIQNGLNQSRNSSPMTVDPAFKYTIDFSDDTRVRGRSGLLASLYPSPVPLAQIMETFQPGSSAALHSTAINPSGTHPFSNPPETVGGEVDLGILVTFEMTLSAGIGADNVASFSITNVTVSPSIIVGSMEFTSGTVTVARACIGDFNNDGGVDGADVEGFFRTWEAGETAADLNADGGVDGGDVEFFFRRWETGC